MADCGLRRAAAWTGLGRIADCTLGALQRTDARVRTASSKKSERAEQQSTPLSDSGLSSDLWRNDHDSRVAFAKRH
eukprot:5318509-Alexandrium_andersonii.AAC.1